MQPFFNIHVYLHIFTHLFLNIMKELFIAGTDKTPEINLSVENCRFEIKGASFSDTVYEDIYKKVLDWIDNEMPSINCKINCIFFINLLNSITYKNLMQILIKLTEYHKSGKDISVTWYFEGDDEDNGELAENLSEVFDIPFTIKAV